MLDFLKEYEKGSFSFPKAGSLDVLCNAPKDVSGVYVVYNSEFRDKPIYIGSSGIMQNNGEIKHRDGGMYDRIVNGDQFGKPRKKSWPSEMEEQEINELLICWFVTFSENVTDIPKFVEAVLIQKHYKLFLALPSWNKSF